MDTADTSYTIENLQSGGAAIVIINKFSVKSISRFFFNIFIVPYELVIKAGNANGTSQLSPPLKFIAADEYIVETRYLKINK